MLIDVPDEISTQYNEIMERMHTLQCVRCGNELLEDAIICRICARVVPYKTHFSPADLNESNVEVGTEFTQHRHLRAGMPEIYRAGLTLLIFLVFVLLTNYGFNCLQKQNIIQNVWSSSLAFSDVFIDRFSADDQVMVNGRLSNVSDVNMQGVIIRVYALNVVNQKIGEEYYIIEPDILIPGSVVEFSITVLSETRLVQRVKVEIYDAQVQPEVLRQTLWS